MQAQTKRAITILFHTLYAHNKAREKMFSERKKTEAQKMQQNMKKKLTFFVSLAISPFSITSHALALNKSFGYQDTGNARLKTFLKGLGFLSYARVETTRREPHCEFN